MKRFLAAIFLLFSTTISYASQGSIVFLIDVSSSIHPPQFTLQTEGYRMAFNEIQSLRGTHVVVIFFGSDAKLVSSGSLADALIAMEHENASRERANVRSSTCLSLGLEEVLKILPSIPQPVVLDISGDGEANCYGKYYVEQKLDEIAKYGVRVNTLFIRNTNTTASPTYLNSGEVFYRDMVRNGGFSIVADGFDDFVYAIFEKIVMEIAWLK